MTILQRTPGPKVTRRLEDPRGFVTGSRRCTPTNWPKPSSKLTTPPCSATAQTLGGVHAFDPETVTTEGVYESGGIYPRHTVITRLAWGKIDPELAQRILEMDGVA